MTPHQENRGGRRRKNNVGAEKLSKKKKEGTQERLKKGWMVQGMGKWIGLLDTVDGLPFDEDSRETHHQ